MSLEAVIQENTSAMRELIAAIKAGVPVTVAQITAAATEPAKPLASATVAAAAAAAAAAASATAAVKEAPAPKGKPTSAPTAPSAPTPPTAEAAVDAAVEKKPEQPAITQPVAAPAAESATPAAEAPTYQDAANAITALSRKKGRDAAIGVLKAFGAAKLPEVKPEQFADVIAAANEAMEA